MVVWSAAVTTTVTVLSPVRSAVFPVTATVAAVSSVTALTITWLVLAGTLIASPNALAELIVKIDRLVFDDLATDTKKLWLITVPFAAVT